MMKLISTFSFLFMLFVLQAQEHSDQFREPFFESYSIREEQHFEIKAHVDKLLKVIGMICPRPCLVQLGKNDTLFDLEGAKNEAKRAVSIYNKLGIAEKFVFDVHPGGHEYENERIFRFFDNYLKQNKN